MDHFYYLRFVHKICKLFMMYLPAIQAEIEGLIPMFYCEIYDNAFNTFGFHYVCT